MAKPSLSDLRAATRGQVISREDADYDPSNLFHVNQNIKPA